MKRLFGNLSMISRKYKGFKNMVYQIYYRKGNTRPRRVLFDIEIYLVQNSFEPDKWYTELHSLSFISGATEFLFDKFNEGNFDIRQFKEDCNVLEELRGYIWEVCNNRPVVEVEAESRMKAEREEIEQKIKFFADKYGLEINID